MHITLKVTGMHCEGCENRIKNVVGKIPGIEKVVGDHKAGTVELDYDGKDSTLTEAKKKISNLDYAVVE